MKASSKPNLYIIAGPNGAGKTTFASEFLPHDVACFEFINADLIAKGLSPFKPEQAAIRAGRLMLEQIQHSANLRHDFAFETTLSGKNYAALLKQLKASGYHISLFFLWMPDVKISLQRIADRVRSGGHNVPADIVKRRFKRGVQNFFSVYRPLVDFWAIFDNSGEMPLLIACEEESDITVYNQSIYTEIIKCGAKL
ncbi:MAG: zeta toxin family protein [Deltaproteobacteria bacterium]|nr:zeta toxin family protein [Deltaproteobacteria bacterium]